jgi:glycosyltransferase involved in cell wall biosynthesis
MNIFLGAYACEPNNGSEPEVGWQMVNEIAKAMPNAMIYAITKANNEELIEEEDYPKNLKFYYYAPPKWLTFWKKGGRGIRIYYYLWLIGAALFMKKQNIKLDIIHHVTFVNDWLPSFFHLLKTKENKFIWGPIGSNDPIDFKFYDNNKMKVQEVVINLLKYFYRNFDPSFHICKKKADCIIGINDNVRDKLKLSDQFFFISDSAISVKKSDVATIESNIKSDNKFTIISVGRLVHIKNFKLTILAFSYFIKNNPNILNVKLKIVGDGKDRIKLEKLAQDLEVENFIEFIGMIPLREVKKYFLNANIFLFPSLENAGFVTLEAMSNSLPVLAMKYGGPEQFIKNNVEDQLVSSTQEYEDIAKDLAGKLELFYNNKELCLKVGIQNKKDIMDRFTWEAKAQKMKNLYQKIVSIENNCNKNSQ